MWDWTEDQMNQLTLVMIRHGLTSSNQQHRYIGKRDEPLSTEGKLQLEAYKKQHCYPDVELLFTSPMKRCIQTAEILYPTQKPVRIEEWEEMDFGAFEGKNYLELQEDERYQAWIDSNGTLPFPGGESREDFRLRCEAGFQKMKKELLSASKMKAGTGLTVGMIVHGGTIMALLSKYCGGDYFDYQAGNGEGYILKLERDTQPEGISLALRHGSLRKLLMGSPPSANVHQEEW